MTLEIVHFYQGSFMAYDLLMYDPDQYFFMKPNTTNINEELGQVEYIFSDKTGTLTRNVMEFKKMSTLDTGFSIFDDSPLQEIENQIKSARNTAQ